MSLDLWGKIAEKWDNPFRNIFERKIVTAMDLWSL